MSSASDSLDSSLRGTPEHGTPEINNWGEDNAETESALEDSRLQPWKEIVEKIKSKECADEQNHDGADWFQVKHGYYYNHTS